MKALRFIAAWFLMLALFVIPLIVSMGAVALILYLFYRFMKFLS